MDKLRQAIYTCGICIALFSTTSLGLVGISKEGDWPASWPEELDQISAELK